MKPRFYFDSQKVVEYYIYFPFDALGCELTSGYGPLHVLLTRAAKGFIERGVYMFYNSGILPSQMHDIETCGANDHPVVIFAKQLCQYMRRSDIDTFSPAKHAVAFLTDQFRMEVESKLLRLYENNEYHPPWLSNT